MQHVLEYLLHWYHIGTMDGVLIQHPYRASFQLPYRASSYSIGLACPFVPDVLERLPVALCRSMRQYVLRLLREGASVVLSFRISAHAISGISVYQRASLFVHVADARCVSSAKACARAAG